MSDGVDAWIANATRDQLVAKRNEYRSQMTQDQWQGRDNDLRHGIIRRIDRRLDSVCPGCGFKMIEGHRDDCQLNRLDLSSATQDVDTIL